MDSQDMEAMAMEQEADLVMVAKEAFTKTTAMKATMMTTVTGFKAVQLADLARVTTEIGTKHQLNTEQMETITTPMQARVAEEQTMETSTLMEASQLEQAQLRKDPRAKADKAGFRATAKNKGDRGHREKMKETMDKAARVQARIQSEEKRDQTTQSSRKTHIRCLESGKVAT